jgi:hypothetical protein
MHFGTRPIAVAGPLLLPSLRVMVNTSKTLRVR